MAQEQIFFHQGLTFDARSSLQKPGFLKQAENILFEREGIQDLRPFFYAYNSTAVNAIHSIKGWRNKIIIGDKLNLRGSSGGAAFTTLLATASGMPWQFKVYKDFLTGTDQTNFVLIDQSLNAYPAIVANPTVAASGVAGSSGSPNGTYRLYYSFFITWPNGHTYETGLSPTSADVTVSSKHITWTIATCPYVAYHGTAPTIYRNLYRGPGTGGTLTEIYFVATVTNNMATTYDDNISDASLQTAIVDPVTGYDVPIVPKYLEWHYGRLFAIDPTYINRLWYSEVAQGSTGVANEQLMPLAMLDTNWDDIRVPGLDDVDPQGLISWGSYLYIALKQTWLRKQGDDPDTWAYRKTYAQYGIGAPYTVDAAPQGVIGVTNPEASEVGIAVFNGLQSEMIASPKLDYLFKTDLNIAQITQCRGKMVGRYYFLLYPSIESEIPDRMLALDMRRYPDIRVANWTDLNGNSIDADTQGTQFYVGGSDGYVRQKSVVLGDAMDVTIETHDVMGSDAKAANIIKTWKEMKYILDSGGDDVTIQFYIDDVLMSWPDGTTTRTISGTGEAVQLMQSFPPNWKGYKLRILLTGTSMTSFTLYSPWSLEFDATG